MNILGIIKLFCLAWIAFGTANLFDKVTVDSKFIVGGMLVVMIYLDMAIENLKENNNGSIQ